LLDFFAAIEYNHEHNNSHDNQGLGLEAVGLGWWREEGR
jgi:hypothetical protein